MYIRNRKRRVLNLPVFRCLTSPHLFFCGGAINNVKSTLTPRNISADRTTSFRFPAHSHGFTYQLIASSFLRSLIDASRLFSSRLFVITLKDAVSRYTSARTDRVLTVSASPLNYPRVRYPAVKVRCLTDHRRCSP